MGGAATHAAPLGSHVARAGQRDSWSRDHASRDLGAEELEVLLGELVILEEAQLRTRRVQLVRKEGRDVSS